MKQEEVGSPIVTPKGQHAAGVYKYNDSESTNSFHVKVRELINLSTKFGESLKDEVIGLLLVATATLSSATSNTSKIVRFVLH